MARGSSGARPTSAAARESRRGSRWRWLVGGVAAGMLLGVALALVASRALWVGPQQEGLQRLETQVADLARRLDKVEGQVSGLSRTERATVYWTQSTGGPQPALVPVGRRVPLGVTPADRVRAAMEALLAGPTPEERRARLFSQIPEGVKVRSVRVEGETAYIDFTRGFEQTAGTLRLSGMLRQVVFTATEVPPVRRVVLLVEGERVGTEAHPFTGDGLLFDELSRERLPL